MGEKQENSEGSLHDSMEILEEIATEDHFDHLDRGGNVDSDQSFEQEDSKIDIFEMPPMPDTLNNDNSSQDHQQPPPTSRRPRIHLLIWKNIKHDLKLLYQRHY